MAAKSPHATATFSSDETYVSGTSVQARLKVFARDGLAWDITYYSHCKWWSNNVAFEATIATNHATGIGTGDWTYADVGVPAPVSTNTSSGGVSTRVLRPGLPWTVPARPVNASRRPARPWAP